MPVTQVNEISMYYEIHGQGEPIVFVAGFSCDLTAWAGIVDFFKNDFQVILFDNRGAGQTDIPDSPYTIEQMADDTAGLCAALGIKQAHFVGNSMGGFILQALAKQYPALVKCMILSNTALSALCGFHIYAAAQLELLKANAPMRALVHASCGWAFSYGFLRQPDKLEQLIQLTLDNPFPFTVRGYEGQYAALDQFDSSSWAHQISAPTLIMSGDEDLILPKQLAQKLADTIPNSQYFNFNQCGHLPYIEYPEQFCDLVRAFVRQK